MPGAAGAGAPARAFLAVVDNSAGALGLGEGGPGSRLGRQVRAAALAAAARCGGGRGGAGLVALHAPPGRQVVAPPEAGWGLPGAGFARVLAAPPRQTTASRGTPGRQCGRGLCGSLALSCPGR